MRWVCPECGDVYAGAGVCPRDGNALADASYDPLLGETLGSWRVTRLIGQGGMGRVYRGLQPAIGSRVAIKVLGEAKPALIERFFAEARTVNVIRHEHIVNILDFAALSDSRPYIVMEYLDGATLGALIARAEPLPLGWLVRVVIEVLSALSAAHAHAVIHRDLKPDNVFVTPAGHAKVLDFGIAKLRAEANSPMPETRAGALMGTPFYMSPEQAAGRSVDARSDIYSLGVVLYECVTGRRPFLSENLYELLRMHIEVPPEPPSRFRSDLAPALEQCILRAMQKDPALRFQSAAEMAAQLSAAVAHLPNESFTYPGLAGALTIIGQASRPITPAVGGTVGAPLTGISLPAVTAAPARAMHAARWPWLVAAGGLFMFVMLIGAVVVYVWQSQSEPKRASSTHAPASVTVAESVPIGPDGKPRRLPVDVTGEVDRAQRLAREKIADAELVRIDATGMDARGRVDLYRTGLDSEPSVEYVFRSQSRTLLWAKEPANAKKTRCEVRVTFGLDGIQVYDNADSCEGDRVPKPRCSGAKIWTRAVERGGTGDQGSFGYRKQDDGNDAEWYVSMPGFDGWIADAC